MANLLQLASEINDLYDDELVDYLEDFFGSDKLSQYSFDSLQNKKEKESSSKMFGDDDVIERAVNLLDEDNYCLEAFYVFYRTTDDYSLYLYFDKMFNQMDKYKKLSKYKKFAYKQIIDNYVSFFIELENYTQAIAVQLNIIEKLEVCGNLELSRLAYLFALDEDFDSLYDLYIKVGFGDEASYICLIVTALKNNEELKAIDVLNDFLGEFKYAEYLDHPWDLEKIDDADALKMNEAISVCYRFIKSVPYFMHWCKSNKKEMIAKA